MIALAKRRSPLRPHLAFPTFRALQLAFPHAAFAILLLVFTLPFALPSLPTVLPRTPLVTQPIKNHQKCHPNHAPSF
jgi:hypothetical protein